MSDRELIARAIYDYVDDEGIDWGDLDEGERDQARGIAEAVLAALGATGDDVLVALPRPYVYQFSAWEAGVGRPTPYMGTGEVRAISEGCRAALARGRREPVKVTLDPDDARGLRDLALNSLVVPDNRRASIIAALDAALGATP